MEQYFDLFLDPASKIPCYFSDHETHEILYFNEPMNILIDITDESYLGESSFDVVFSSTETFEEYSIENLSVEKGKFSTFRFYSPKIQSYLNCCCTLIEYGGRLIRYVKLLETTSDFSPLEKISFQTAITKCVEILFTTSREEQITSFLALLGQYYQSEKTFFFIMHTRSQGATEVFHWSRDKEASGPVPTRETALETDFFTWATTGTHLEVLTNDLLESNVTGLTSEELKIYQEKNFNNVSICSTFTKNDQLKTILGVLNQKCMHEEHSLLKIVAQFIQMSYDIYHVTSQKNEEKDKLTGAFNREKYNIVLQSLKFHKPQDIGVAFINANGLRKTNQYYGLPAGDKLIQDSMLMAQKYFPQPWYRLSGDEFICFVTDWTEEQFNQTLSQLHTELSSMPQRTFALGSAWGTQTNDVDKLVDTADTMMFIDKQTYYTDFDPQKMEFFDQVLQDLLLAVQEEEFMVYLQPKFSLRTEQLVGAEALIRRFSKKLNKMIFPDQFIPLYEKKSIIRHVDLFVLRKVCQLLSEWNKVGKKLKVSVNLSRVTLLEHGVVHKFAEICDDYNIDHEQIVVEVTERVGLIENDVESPLIEQFKQYGFQISLDDFGCAYSNIVTLATISVDEVKIDKSLVDNILTNPKNKAIVENMIRMVDDFGETSTLAEGVETQEQADCLRECNCEFVQGYFYSRPIPSEDFFDKYIKESC